MTIGRSQISKQVEGKLSGARDEKEKRKEISYLLKKRRKTH